MKTLILITIILICPILQAQVITTVPFVLDQEINYLPYEGIDHLPYGIGDPSSQVYEELYYWSLVGAGTVESLYFQDEEWQHECRISKDMMLRQLDSLKVIIDRCVQLWSDLENTETDPEKLSYIQAIKPYALGRLSTVELRRSEYRQILLYPKTVCAENNSRLDLRINGMLNMRYHLEQQVMPMGFIYVE